MPETKTKPTPIAPADFLGAVEGQRGADARALCALMAEITGAPATMWGPAIVGFGIHHYKYDSGREGDICKIGFSPRKAALTLYGMGLDRNADLVARLGKHTTGKGCLYLKKLSDADEGVLRDLVRAAWEQVTPQSSGG